MVRHTTLCLDNYSNPNDTPQTDDDFTTNRLIATTEANDSICWIIL